MIKSGRKIPILELSGFMCLAEDPNQAESADRTIEDEADEQEEGDEEDEEDEVDYNEGPAVSSHRIFTHRLVHLTLQRVSSRRYL